MSSAPAEPAYGVLVPIKAPAIAKSRLSSLGDEVRRALVTAFATDTITTALESPHVGLVLAVTDDHVLATGLADLGAQVIPDGATDDLNGSLVQAAAELSRRRPELRIAAICADLPALREAELSQLLLSAPDDRAAFVADAQGVGTTVLLAPSVEQFDPRFGPGSRAAHLHAGAHEIDLSDVPSLRRDVDTTADLLDAIRLGVGGRTAMATTGIRL